MCQCFFIPESAPVILRQLTVSAPVTQTIESVLLSFVNDVMCLLTLFLNILVVQNGFPNVVVIQNLETSGNHLPH